MKQPDKESLFNALLNLPESAREHMKHVVRLISMCYLDERQYTFGVAIVWDNDMLHVMPIGADEEQTLELMRRGADVIFSAKTPVNPPDGAHIH